MVGPGLSAATGGQIPMADDAPNFAQRSPGTATNGPEYKDPSVDDDHEWPQKALQTSEDVRLIEVLHNRFQIDDGQKDVRGEFTVESVQPPQFRVMRLDGNQCITEQLMTAQEYQYDEKIVKAWRTTVYVDEDLEWWYSHFTTSPAKTTSLALGTVGVGGQASRMVQRGRAVVAAGLKRAATGNLATLNTGARLMLIGGTAQVLATGATAFISASSLMSGLHGLDIPLGPGAVNWRLRGGSRREVDAGWAAVFKFRANEQPIGQPEERWVQIGDPHPCPPERVRTGDDPPRGQGVVPGGDLTPGPDADEDRRGSMLPQSPAGVSVLVCAAAGLVLLAAAPLLALRDGNASTRTTAEGAVATRPAATTPPAASASRVGVKPIVATAGATTQYVVAVESAPAGGTLTYSWSGATCGTAQADGPRYVWDHREASVQLRGGLLGEGDRELGRAGDCRHTAADATHGNPVIAVDIAGEGFTAHCTIQGAGSGTGSPCEVNQTATAQQAAEPPGAAGGGTSPAVSTINGDDGASRLPLVSAICGVVLLGVAGAGWYALRARQGV